MIKKPAKTSLPIHDLISGRWSGRAFKTDAISREKILTMVEAAHWAPSCFNDQPWRFLVWDKNHDADAWQKAFDCLDDGNQEWVVDAPVLLLVCSDTEFSKRPGRANRWGQHDAGMASQNLHLQAVALGLMTHPMAGYDKARARETFKIPERYDLLAMIAVGKPVDSADDLEGRRKERELAERIREPVGTRMFDSRWDKPIT
ncbi:MAG: nitroreductase family protein [Acidiferrobacterales bacterium]|jgi:nitroreductase|nr:nitroreductase family protein [Acidiferrobacterales bacterium]